MWAILSLFVGLSVLPTSSSVHAQDSGPEAPASAQAKSAKALKAQEAVGQAGAASQERVNKTDDETKTLLDEYRVALKKLENTRAYNEQLRILIDSQKSEIVSIQKQIEQVKDTGKDIVPLMGRMLESLKAFVELDKPFLPEERSNRMKQLTEMMARADVSTSEKYRRVLEGYQVENEYGRTIEAYRSNLAKDGKDLTVDFLRIGRLALIYQTLDGDEAGVWDNNKKTWVELPGSYAKGIQQAIRVARKQQAPDLLALPILPEASKGATL